MRATRPKISPDPSLVYRKLSRWFARTARSFPWRGETDPYRVWISEILLVQTTTAVGIPRYRRFLNRFPTLRSLIRASSDQIMKEWEGLGYYHRARNLHRAAQIIASRYGGRFPQDYDAIRALPGIGEYCAAAISNLCFNGMYPSIDGNVARVGARLFGIRGDVRGATVRRQIHERLTEWMKVGRGSTWTSALIDLGATVCLPRTPHCSVCPLEDVCVARLNGLEQTLGLPQAKPQRKVVQVACGIIRRGDGRILIAQRLETGLLPNLWEFPGGKRDGNESLARTCAREIKEELGIDVTVGKRRMVIAHAYSHYAVRLHVFECRFKSGKPRALGCQRFRWVTSAQLGGLAFPTANRRIIAEIVAESD